MICFPYRQPWAAYQFRITPVSFILKIPLNQGVRRSRTQDRRNGGDAAEEFRLPRARDYLDVYAHEHVYTARNGRCSRRDDTGMAAKDLAVIAISARASAAQRLHVTWRVKAGNHTWSSWSGLSRPIPSTMRNNDRC